MTTLGELRQHPDWPRLVAVLQKKVDSATIRVLRASKEDSLEDIRFYSGRRSLAVELLTELLVKED